MVNLLGNWHGMAGLKHLHTKKTPKLVENQMIFKGEKKSSHYMSLHISEFEL